MQQRKLHVLMNPKSWYSQVAWIFSMLDRSPTMWCECYKDTRWQKGLNSQLITHSLGNLNPLMELTMLEIFLWRHHHLPLEIILQTILDFISKDRYSWNQIICLSAMNKLSFLLLLLLTSYKGTIGSNCHSPGFCVKYGTYIVACILVLITEMDSTLLTE